MNAPPMGFVCPRCRASVTIAANSRTEWYQCSACSGQYPIVLGIPDFRLFADPWIEMADDRAKGLRLFNETRHSTFVQTVEAYWAMTPETPRQLARRFTESVLSAESRSAEWLDRCGAITTTSSNDRWIDIGCGTGDLLVAGASRGLTMVGADIAFRWLVVARKRCEEAGMNPTLVCCNAEHLPFANESFGDAACLSTLEHCKDAIAVLSESRRVLRKGGAIRLRTHNRYTALREPHVGVWGVGLVPRRWANKYVRWRSNREYLHHRPLSQAELKRALRNAGFASVNVRAAQLLGTDRARLGSLEWAATAYEHFRRVPVVGSGLSWIAPFLDAQGVVG